MTSSLFSPNVQSLFGSTLKSRHDSLQSAPGTYVLVALNYCNRTLIHAHAHSHSPGFYRLQCQFFILQAMKGWGLERLGARLHVHTHKNTVTCTDVRAHTHTHTHTHTGTVMFLHWLAGMIFIFYLASFVMLMREVLRPGVLWFLRNLNDHNFHPIYEVCSLVPSYCIPVSSLVRVQVP